tara:strand:+ start:182 stop:400 length:219 start_codon:yes stop_codon:yes gene_type:complete
MKEQKWDDALKGVQEIFDSSAFVSEEGSEIKLVEKKPKSHITQLRRRIEERLDSKRIALEYDDFEDNAENLQ